MNIEQRDVELLKQIRNLLPNINCDYDSCELCISREKALDKTISLAQSYLTIKGLLPEKKEVKETCKGCAYEKNFGCPICHSNRAFNSAIDLCNLRLLKNFPSYAHKMGYVKVGELPGEKEMTDKEATNWLKVRIGKLMGCNSADRDKVYTLAIRALENQRAMKEEAKHNI